MSSDTDGRASAFAVMAMDILSNVLGRVDNPGAMGACLAEEVRDVTGARCVMLIQCMGASTSTVTETAHRVVSINPARRRDWAESAEGNHLFELVHRVSSAELWRAGEGLEASEILRREGFELSMVFPLTAGGARVGAMLVLGLPDERHITSVLNLLNNLTTIAGLVLRAAIMFERQEQLIQERTAELRDKNEKLAIELAERRRAEETVRTLNRELDQRVNERTVRLEAALKELEAFAYSVSHDLRTPLRGIDGFSQALLDDYSARLDDEGKDYLRRVRAGAQRMAKLLDDMLSLSRVSRVEMRREKVDLCAIAREIADDLVAHEPRRKVLFTIVPEATVIGDARHLRIVLANLLGNAWKFTSRIPEARIEFGVVEKDGRPAYFVRDNGVGFDAKYAGRLFGTFQRLHTMEEFPGSGVGLAIVQRIIQRHGGQVWAEGRINEGATFFFSLPQETKGAAP